MLTTDELRALLVILNRAGMNSVEALAVNAILAKLEAMAHTTTTPETDDAD